MTSGKKRIFLLLTGLGLVSQALAQTGSFEARLRSRRVDCEARRLEVDVELRAKDAGSQFRMGNANFRFSYDPAFVRSPVLAKQHQFTSVGQTPDANYASQSLNGSAERPGLGIVSLNVIYAGGDKGATLVSADWMPVATIQFDLVNPHSDKGTTLVFHDQKTFPVSGAEEVIIKNENETFDYTSKEVASAGVFESLTLQPFARICAGIGMETSGEVQIPDGFSPNGDGNNDLFVIKNLGMLKAELQIFDRSGTVLYDSRDYQNDWSGQTARGQIAPGTYFYTIKLSDGRKFSRSITIVR